MSSDDQRIGTQELLDHAKPVHVDTLTPWDQDPYQPDVGHAAVMSGEFGQGTLVLTHGTTVVFGSAAVDAQRHQPDDDGTVPAVDLAELGWSMQTAQRFATGLWTAAKSATTDEALLAELLTGWASEDMALLDGTGFDGDDLDALLEGLDLEPITPFDIDPDDVPEPPPTPVTNLGDVWLLGAHRLTCADSFTVDLPDCGALISDPPYGMKVDTSWYGNVAPSQFQSLGKLEWDQDEFDPSRFAAHTKVCALFGANYYCHKLAGPGTWWVWDKRSSDADDDIWGAGWGIQFELAWISVPVAHKIIRHKWAGFIKDSDDEKLHPTQKPVAVMSELVTALTDQGQVVLDPFSGSGSTLIACEQTGRVCHAIELDPHYCDVIATRFQQLTGVKPILESTGVPHDFGGG